MSNTCKHKKIVAGQCSVCGEELESQFDDCRIATQTPSSNSGLQYINRLYSLKVNSVVVAWIIDQMSRKKKKVNKIKDPDLFVLICIGNIMFNVKFKKGKLGEKMGVDINDTKIKKKLAGSYGKHSILTGIEASVPISISSPVDYIEEVLNDIYDGLEIKTSKEILITEIKEFARSVFNFSEKVRCNKPIPLAIAFIRYFINECIVTKKIALRFFVKNSKDYQKVTLCHKVISETINKGIKDGQIEII